jgi:hypothetical protein
MIGYEQSRALHWHIPAADYLDAIYQSGQDKRHKLDQEIREH